MSSKHESHRHTLRELMERSMGTAHSDAFKDKLVDEILLINDRYNRSPDRDWAHNTDGSHKP